MDNEVTRCQDCGRKLRAARSVAARRGPTCAAKIRRAPAPAQAKPEQVTKAAELIDDGGIVRTSRPGVYAAASGDGSTIYITDVNNGSCTCKAGEHGRYCYHLAAAEILTAAAAARRAA